MTEFHQTIADLEEEIEALSDRAEQCRKSLIVAKVAITAGVLLFGAVLLGLTRTDPIVLILGIAIALAGIVFFGSSQSTLEEIAGQLKACEMRRIEMIDGMDLQPVHNS